MQRPWIVLRVYYIRSSRYADLVKIPVIYFTCCYSKHFYDAYESLLIKSCCLYIQNFVYIEQTVFNAI